MTIATENNRKQYSGNGATTVFAYDFKISASADLNVILTSAAGVETTLVLTTDYTVSGVGVEAGGDVTCVTAPATGTLLTIRRIVALTQLTDLTNQTAFQAETLENAYDKDVMMIQQLKEEVDRSLKVAASDTNTMTLPTAELRKNGVWAFDSNGDTSIIAPVAGQNLFRQYLSTIDRTVTSKLYEIVSVKDFGAVGDGITDDTVAIQNALTVGVSVGKAVFLPGGTYLVTSTLNMPQYTQLYGEHKHQGYIGGTIIDFQPASLKNLFTATPVNNTTKTSISIEDIYIKGNSTSSAGLSNNAFYLGYVSKSSFKNIRLAGFRRGFECKGTLNNRFQFIAMSYCYEYCVYYSGDYATTDVWDQCYYSSAPIGIQTDGINIAIRHNNCIFESLDTYGVHLVKESVSWHFANTYAESVPNANIATNAMFKVGFIGTACDGPMLTIIGGHFGGRNAGAVGSFLDVDTCEGIMAGGFIASRYTNVVQTSSNTALYEVVLNGFQCASVSNVVTDVTKIAGIYPYSAYGGGQQNNQYAQFLDVKAINAIIGSSVAAGRLTLSTASVSSDSGVVCLGNQVATGVGAAGGATALPATPLGYLVAYRGTQQIQIPYYLP